ncbi:DoxX family membrane protein [Streptomyces sp. CAU 1734]|uniref:DoxX family membrane protein n=1 Tax=Streptomyces sp. CAU 1734 TaxID=3140360 RepID=UPI0032617CEF
MVKVDCDPAQVIVNHASFRVRLAPSPRMARGQSDTARIPVVGAGGTVVRRRAPVVWSGRSAPGDSGATGLLQAVRNSTATATAERERYGSGGEGYGSGGYDTGSTQLIPRVDLVGDTVGTTGVADTGPIPVIGTRSRPLLPPMRQAIGAYDAHQPYGPPGSDHDPYDDEPTAIGDHPDSPGGETVRHAYYPGRRMNLGVVLLPLRVFLGFISIYAGMGKLCDPVYFDGGERGSMMKWLHSLDPWPLAEPLRDFALSHPVGAGLTVAFLQVVVGVLTVLGLWQRVAAVVGALLSAALILTVSWKTVPAYDAPDIIYLAAWSPLIIAGAPVYSIDGRLAGEAWRKLGPRTEIGLLRRRVLRRGSLVAAVVVGLTLLIGSMLGGAVRSTDLVTVPGPNQDPTNYLPGSSLPDGRPTGERSSSGPSGSGGDKPSPSASRAETPERRKSTPETSEDRTVRETAGTTAGAERSSSPASTGGAQPPGRSQPAQQQPPAGSSVPSSSGGAGSGGSGSAPGGTPDNTGSTGGGSSSGGSTGGDSGRVIGGLLG